MALITVLQWCLFSDVDSMSPLTLGMMGWAAVMTLSVGIIVAAVIIRRRRTSTSSDLESSIVSTTDVVAAPTATEDTIAQVHNIQTSSS